MSLEKKALKAKRNSGGERGNSNGGHRESCFEVGQVNARYENEDV